MGALPPFLEYWGGYSPPSPPGSYAYDMYSINDNDDLYPIEYLTVVNCMHAGSWPFMIKRKSLVHTACMCICMLRGPTPYIIATGRITIVIVHVLCMMCISMDNKI